jgi:hypothetical protein
VLHVRDQKILVFGYLLLSLSVAGTYALFKTMNKITERTRAMQLRG